MLQSAKVVKIGSPGPGPKDDFSHPTWVRGGGGEESSIPGPRDSQNSRLA